MNYREIIILLIIKYVSDYLRGVYSRDHIFDDGKWGLIHEQEEQLMPKAPSFIETFVTAATTMPTENLAIVGICLVALAVIFKGNNP